MQLCWMFPGLVMVALSLPTSLSFTWRRCRTVSWLVQDGCVDVAGNWSFEMPFMGCELRYQVHTLLWDHSSMARLYFVNYTIWLPRV